MPRWIWRLTCICVVDEARASVWPECAAERQGGICSEEQHNARYARPAGDRVGRPYLETAS